MNTVQIVTITAMLAVAQAEPEPIELNANTSIAPGLMEVDETVIVQRNSELLKNRGHEGMKVRPHRLLSKGRAGSHIHDGGKLTGTSVYTSRAGSPLAIVPYVDDRRNGPARLWDGKEPLLFIDYKAGKRNGLQVYFSSGKPTVAEIYNDDKLTEAFLIEHDGDQVTVTPEKNLDGQQQTFLTLSRGSIEAQLTTMAIREKAARKQIASGAAEKDPDAGMEELKAIIRGTTGRK